MTIFKCHLDRLSLNDTVDCHNIRRVNKLKEGCIVDALLCFATVLSEVKRSFGGTVVLEM